MSHIASVELYLHGAILSLWILLGARELVKPSLLRKDDHGNLGVAQNRQFVGFLEEAIAPLREGDLPACCVLDPPHLNLPSHHFCTDIAGKSSS